MSLFEVTIKMSCYYLSNIFLSFLRVMLMLMLQQCVGVGEKIEYLSIKSIATDIGLERCRELFFTFVY